MQRMMRLIDIGANLTDPMFRGLYRGKQAHADDFNLVLQRAQEAGVKKMFITGTNLEDSKEAIESINSHKEATGFLYSTVGCHPTRCSEFDEYKDGPDAYFEQLLDLALKHPSSVIAIGECGLDYDRLHFCDKETQKKYFRKQFDLAEKTNLPMFLHNRNTGNDFYDLVKENRHKFKHGVVHSFTGTREEMQKLCDLGLYIGVNGCSLKTQENLDVVQAIPEDRLMIETDAPWCDIRPTHASYAHLKNIPEQDLTLYSPPSKKKEKFEMGLMVKSRNEPCTLGLVLYVVASLKNKDPKELSEIIWNNTCRVFNTV
ncbi:putative deoxyribonuclease TATDN1-like protein [Mycotypha africana]|uniref:putative deoxyribonuclease TATDN1-like protein n=1 Tax=Mycotypha africana TaxID=64632 RepID=UPI002301CF89|nr:putative deoxyribonuclease TATDN1-like protein [Mycotypha africana]KAI8967735.1 putative deoxyribonuclease TATDN1-like protein [Mycotypha africana]